MKEYDRARAIYKYALDQLPRGAAQQLYETFNKFEKQHGSRCVATACAVKRETLAMLLRRLGICFVLTTYLWVGCWLQM